MAYFLKKSNLKKGIYLQIYPSLGFNTIIL